MSKPKPKLSEHGFTPEEIAFFEEGEQLAENVEPFDDFSDLDTPASSTRSK